MQLERAVPGHAAGGVGAAPGLQLVEVEVRLVVRGDVALLAAAVDRPQPGRGGRRREEAPELAALARTE